METLPIYSHNATNTARYLLGEESETMIAILGINPSTACSEHLDRTMLSVKRIANYNGYDGFLMLNVYPQRATDPARIHKRINNQLHKENLAQIASAIQRYNFDTLWLAYGDLIGHRKYFIPCLVDIFELLKPNDLNYRIAGKLTAKGNPRHPLYQAAKSKLQDFDIKMYLEEHLNLTKYA
ncbi:DUF1643 domain-containing protein [Gilvibacter sediminis]|uniref:DUF1643 domain-containing protein n=1 Tax=Gilvibacter sediminis TaxID=379071 RepID=UPI002350699D|nr:DUF1643 domain-containing protein [Gilvibacter sediminis]MDC7996480.1 DUF1643 domain-containing protein [Gilvibacter sediminis]